MLTVVAQGVGSAFIVTTGDLSDPIGRIACNRGDGLGGFALSQQPEDVKMVAYNRGDSLPIVLL
jgi:hypothetical protein